MARRTSRRSISIFLVVTFLGAIWMVASIFNGPHWELSAINAEDGVRVEVFKEGEKMPTYRTLLPRKHIRRNLYRVTIDELPPDVGRTKFFDVTLKPGRWTVVIDGTELDIMERGLIVDGGIELAPAGVND